MDRAKAERYYPVDEGDILFDLASIAAPADAVAFAHRYGLLTKGGEDEELRESFNETREEAEVLWMYLRLYEVLRRAGHDDYDDAVRELRSMWLPPLVATAERLGLNYRPPDGDDELVAWCREFLGLVINDGMRGTDWIVVPEPDGWSLSGWPEDLISHAYLQLAFLIVERRPVLVCEECGRVFPVEHGRQRFCTPACSGRARNRRWREGEGKGGS